MVFLELQDHAGEITEENTVRSAAEHKDCKARNARAGNWENNLVAVYFLLLPSVILGACGAGGHLGGGIEQKAGPSAEHPAGRTHDWKSTDLL